MLDRGMAIIADLALCNHHDIDAATTASGYRESRSAAYSSHTAPVERELPRSSSPHRSLSIEWLPARREARETPATREATVVAYRRYSGGDERRIINAED